MPIFLVMSDDLPEELFQLLGKARPLLRRGTAYDIAKTLLEQGGGPSKTEQIWQIDSTLDVEEAAFAEIASFVRAGIADEGELALSLRDLPVPIFSLFEIAKATGTILTLAALFERDPDDTRHD